MCISQTIPNHIIISNICMIGQTFTCRFATFRKLLFPPLIHTRCRTMRGGRGRGWYYAQKYGKKSDRAPLTSPQSPSNSPPSEYTDGDIDLPSQTDGASTLHFQKGQVKSVQELMHIFERIDGRGYPAYKDIYGTWEYPSGARLRIDWIQGDPYASPSRCRVLVPSQMASFPPEFYENRIRKIALEDFLTRSFGAAVSASGGDVRAQSQGWKGEKGGDMMVDRPGQHVIERSSVEVHRDGAIEARFTIGLPARGRTVLGTWASSILCHNLPRYISKGLVHRSLDAKALQQHVRCIEDSETLRNRLEDLGLIAFIADGSILPRASGDSDLPMPSSDAVPFQSPESLAVVVDLPHRGKVRGMGLRKGITLICGGGFHGKTTVLEALQSGVYNKVPHDGRELVVTHNSAVKIRAEDGRCVNSVDISPYINNLPLEKDTKSFDSMDASGSTSQAANIQEALEVGAEVLLIDEDTSATNFMVRDSRMSELVAPEKEPISPFIDRIEALRDSGTSTVLVLGGTGEYFGLADTVLVLDSYRVHDATSRAHDIARRHEEATAGRILPRERLVRYPPVSPRVLRRVASEHSGGRGLELRAKTKGTFQIALGHELLDVHALEQLVEESQTRAIAHALTTLQGCLASGRWKGLSMCKILESVEQEIDRSGLDWLTHGNPLGNLARPRRYEIAAAINRVRTAQFVQMT